MSVFFRILSGMSKALYRLFAMECMTPAPPDDDGDGIPNDWEISNGLNKDNPDDRNAIGSDGYTNLEIFLNSLTEANATIVETLPAIRWNHSLNADHYDVYFGSDNPPPFRLNQPDTTFHPEKLEKGTTYYWRIDAKNGFGTTTGQTWSFYVKEGINAGQIAHWKLDETIGVIAVRR